jgi:AcrR family transcriptional regulator
VSVSDAPAGGEPGGAPAVEAEGAAAVDGPVDGRSARAERTRTAIVDALISLLEEGDLQPTANRIADRAGISLRLIYHHFGDLESLYRAVAQRTLERLLARTHRVPLDQPLAQRIDELVDQRTDVLEWLSPVMRAAQLSIPPQPGLAGSRNALHNRGEREVELVFRPELEALPAGPRATLLAALNGALFWGHWDDLRKSGRSVDEARASVLLTIRALLATVPGTDLT